MFLTYSHPIGVFALPYLTIYEFFNVSLVCLQAEECQEDTEWLVRFSAAVSLGNLGDVRAYDALIQALDSHETMLHQTAIAALGEVGDLRCVDQILRFAQSDDCLTRQRLAESLGHLIL